VIVPRRVGQWHVLQAQLLLVGPALDVKLSMLEVMDDSVGPAGCKALGDALMLGGNSTLTTLRLDLNRGIGDEGALHLCRGLRTNKTLTVSAAVRVIVGGSLMGMQTLTMTYCNLTSASSVYLSEVLAAPTCSLVDLDLRGNALGSEGLLELARAVSTNTKLEGLVLADNSIGTSASEVNQAAIEALGGALAAPATTSALARVDLEMNSWTLEDAERFVPFLESNPKVVLFKIDTSLPSELFDKLFKDETGKKKGKGKKKKK
jgi:hypothetical protein